METQSREIGLLAILIRGLDEDECDDDAEEISCGKPLLGTAPTTGVEVTIHDAHYAFGSINC